MKIILEIPKNFENHFNTDRFEDSIKRVKYDSIDISGAERVAGLYDHEVIEMLIDKLKNAQPIVGDNNE